MKTALMFFYVALIGSELIAQQPDEIPRVVHADVPDYPRLAQLALIQGKVKVKFTVKGGEVQATVLQSGHPLLATATIANIKTWHFGREVNGSITTEFEYRIKVDKGKTNQNPRIEMQLPTFVRITIEPETRLLTRAAR